MNRQSKTITALAAGLLMMSACSRSEPDVPVDDNTASETATPAEDAAPTVTPDTPPPTETTPVDANSVAMEAPPEPKIAPDAQMLDDADATGMTARVSRDEAPATNDQAAQ